MNPPSPFRLEAPAGWRVVEFISDLHLQPSEPASVSAFRSYLDGSHADAVFVLGDLFEAWVGDDSAAVPGFAADMAALLQGAARRRPLFFMAGNRDFLVGEDLATRAQLRLLPDPTLLVAAGRQWLLSHGDMLCLSDTSYQQYRAQVHTSGWIEQFLLKPLAHREDMARQMRDASRTHQRALAAYADLDADATRAWLKAAGAHTLIHGHTHQPREHALGDGLQRVVLSDWDLSAVPPRAEALRLALDTGAIDRIDLR